MQVAAFEVEGSTLEAIGCVTHTLQLCIKEDLFALPSVKALIELCRALVRHANQSNIWYREFRKNQIEQMGRAPHEVTNLKGDVVTR